MKLDLEAVGNFLVATKEEQGGIISALMAMGVIKHAWIAIQLRDPIRLPWQSNASANVARESSQGPDRKDGRA